MNGVKTWIWIVGLMVYLGRQGQLGVYAEGEAFPLAVMDCADPIMSD